MSNISITPEITAAISANALISFSVSGGKDGAAAALLVNRYLDSIGHPKHLRQLIHADLGSIEWKDSLPSCQRLSERLGIPLKVVRRKGGGMVERWLSRWESSKKRYWELSSVLVIAPWSSASLRFCTSELKMDPIGSSMKAWARELSPSQPVTMLSVLGLRAEESAKRAKAPICAPFLKATLPKSGITALTWNPIHLLSKSEVFDVHREFDFPLHMGYGLGNGRISCIFCILADMNDLTVGSNQAQARGVLHRLVTLEIDSLFSFQSSRWLGSVNVGALSDELRARLPISIKKAEQRRLIESVVPKHLHYTKGWPTCLPTHAEADLIASTRNKIANLYDWNPGAMDGMTMEAVMRRYTNLMDQKTKKDQ